MGSVLSKEPHPELWSFDQAIGQWYALMGKTDYFDETYGVGIFLNYFIKEEFCDTFAVDKGAKLMRQFGSTSNPTHCFGADVDENFPLPDSIRLHPEDRKIYVFGVLKYCYLHREAPTIEQMLEQVTLFLSKAHSNVITPELTKKTVYMINEKFKNESIFYNFIHITNVLSIRYREKDAYEIKLDDDQANDDVILINYNIHNKQQQPLYGVIYCNDECQRLFSIMTASEIRTKYGGNATKLPKPSNFIQPDENFIDWDHNGSKQYAPSITDDDEKKCVIKKPLKSKKSGKRSKKSNSKKKLKFNPYKYNDNAPIRIKSVIKVSKTLTSIIIPSKIREKRIKDIYSYMDKSISLIQWDNKQDFKDERELIFNFDLHDEESNEIIYFKAVKLVDDKRHYKFGILEELFTENTISLGKNQKLPTTVRSTPRYKSQMEMIVKMEQELSKEIHKIINNWKWQDVNVYHRQNNKERLTMSFEKGQFKKKCNNFVKKTKTIELIPLLLFTENDDKYKIVGLWTVRLDEENPLDIAIAFEYNEQNQLIVSGIHIDADDLLLHHQLAVPDHECNCFTNFICNVNDLTIGNPDDLANKYKQSQKQCEKLQSEVSGMKTKCNKLYHQLKMMEKGNKIIQNVKNTGNISPLKHCNVLQSQQNIPSLTTPISIGTTLASVPKLSGLPITNQLPMLQLPMPGNAPFTSNIPILYHPNVSAQTIYNTQPQ